MHIKLIAKGLGSGFHQYVNGVHHLPQVEFKAIFGLLIHFVYPCIEKE